MSLCAGVPGAIMAYPAPAGPTPDQLEAAGLEWAAAALHRRDEARSAQADPGEASRHDLARAEFRLRGRMLAGAVAAHDRFLRHAAVSPDRAAGLTGLGLARLGTGDARGAREVLGRARAAYPESAAAGEAAFWDAEAAWELEDWEGSARGFGEAARGAGASRRGRILYRQAWAENRRGDLAAAATLFAESARLDPALGPASDMQRGWVLLQAGKPAEARPIFETVERADPKGAWAPEAIVGQAECAYRAGEFDEAGRLFDSALARAPDLRAKGPLRYSLAWTAYRQKRIEKARGAFLDVERDFPLDPVAPFAGYRAALCLLDLGHPDDALAELKSVGSRYPAHEVGEWSAYSRGWIHLSLGRFHEAKAAFKALTEQYPKGRLVAPARYLLAAALYQERHFRESEREFLSFADGFPASGLADGAWLWAGWSAELDGRPRDALGHLAQLKARFPESAWAPDAELAEGEAAFALKDWSRARAAYARAAATPGVAPDTRLRAVSGLGWCAFATGDWKEAESQFRRALAEAPAGRAKLVARVRLGDAIFNQKRYDEAREAYRAVVTGGEEGLARWAQLQLGWCAYRADDPNEARRQWDQLRRRWPTSPEAPLALEASAETLFGQEQFAAAEQAFRKLSDEAPGGSPAAERAALRIGDCLYNARAFDRAVIAYRDFTTRYPKSLRLGEALYGMQWAYVQMGDFEQARREARAFLEKFPQASLAAEVQLMVAESFRREKKPEPALEQYRDLIRQYPDSDLGVAARMKSGEALEELGRAKEAEDTYVAFLAKYPAHPLAKEASFRLAVARYAAGNVDGAVEQFEKVAADATDPHAPDALYNLFLCRKKQGREDEMKAVVKRLDEGFARARAAGQARLAYAYWLADAGRGAEAAPQFAAAVESPFRELAAEAAFALGEHEAAAGNPLKALEAYRKGAADLAAGGEWTVQCAFAAANLLAADGKHAEAIEEYRRVFDKADATPEQLATADLGVAQRYEALGQTAKAKQMYQSALARKPPPEIADTAKARLKALGGPGAPSTGAGPAPRKPVKTGGASGKGTKGAKGKKP